MDKKTMMIYEDPLTCEKPEGNALLIKKIKEDGNFQYWRVRFVVDGFSCVRKISHLQLKQ